MLDQMVRDYTENIREAESAVAQTIALAPAGWSPAPPAAVEPS